MTHPPTAGAPRRAVRRAAALFSALIPLLGAGCKTEQTTETSGSETSREQSTAQAGSTLAPGTSGTSKRPKLVPLPGGSVAVLENVKPPVFSVPLDPPLGIFPGKGVGAIRFGATTQTIERLMGVPCGEKTERLCRYPAHAVDFHLDETGVVDEIRIHGDERPLPGKPGETYGMYNGRFLKGAALGMYVQFVIESEGEPSRIEKLEPGQAKPFTTVERHHYENMTLEYDTLENGNVVLAGIVLTRPESSAGAPTGSARKLTDTRKSPAAAKAKK